MLDFRNPVWWQSLAALVASVIGISDPGMQADVKMVLGGMAGLIIAVYTREHHKTVRNADQAAAAVAAAKAAPAAPVVDPAVIEQIVSSITAGTLGGQDSPRVPPAKPAAF